jgi:DNA-binding SARP family transcriptional activator/predicted ATPase
MALLRLNLLGSPHIAQNGGIVHVDTRKAIALIAYLAVNSGYQSRDHLAAILWAENDQIHARGALRRTLSALNTALGGVGLSIEREAIAFNHDAIQCDWYALQQHLRECQSHGHSQREICPACLAPLMQAAAILKGDFMQGFSLRDSAEFDQWQSQQSEHTRRIHASVLYRLVRLYSDSGDYEAAVDIARKWSALDPLNEVAHRHLMQLYAWAEQREAAIRQYRECVRILDRELGTPPLEETSALYRLVVEDKIKSRKQKAPVATVSSVPVKNTEIPPHALPLVGRSDALTQMAQLYHRMQHESDKLVLCIEGEAGIGKTRLIEAFVASGQAHLPHFVIHCYESETDLAYAPLIRALRNALAHPDWLQRMSVPWLNELVRLLPEIVTQRTDVVYQPITDNVAAQSRLLEAIAQAFDTVVSADKPMVLIVEDLQWVDRATLDFLSYYLRRTAHQPKLHILTWRDAKNDVSDYRQRVLAEVERAGVTLHFLHLQRLDSASVQQLAQHAGIADSALIDRLYLESEGLPFFLVEFLAFVKAEAGHAGNGDAAWILPRSIESLLRSRLAFVGEAAQQLLGAASVIGRSFDDALLQECSGRSDDEMIAGLDALLRYGLLIHKFEQQTQSYDFFHDTLRHLVYEDMNTARRRLLHKRTAYALLHRKSALANFSQVAGEIAHHFHKGGNDSEAAKYYYDAGIHARHLFANREAIHHFSMALALSFPDAAQVYQQLGDVYVLISDYAQAIQNYESALAHCLPELTSSLEHAIGCVYHRLGEWAIAERQFQRAIDILDADHCAEHARILVDWSLTAYNRKHIEKAGALAQSALELALQCDDSLALAQCHNVLSIYARYRDDLTTAHQHHQASLAIAAKMGIISMTIAIQNNLALTLIEEEQLQEAEVTLQQALALCERQGDRHRAAALHNNLADVYHQLQQPERAMQHLKQAVALFTQIGQAVDTLNAEIWRLSEW